jgi:hypothetical protein
VRHNDASFLRAGHMSCAVGCHWLRWHVGQQGDVVQRTFEPKGFLRTPVQCPVQIKCLDPDSNAGPTQGFSHARSHRKKRGARGTGSRPAKWILESQDVDYAFPYLMDPGLYEYEAILEEESSWSTSTSFWSDEDVADTQNGLNPYEL